MSWEWEKDLRNCSGSHKWEKREKWEKDLSSALHSDLKGDCGMVGVALSTQAAAIGHGRTTSGCARTGLGWRSGLISSLKALEQAPWGSRQPWKVQKEKKERISQSGLGGRMVFGQRSFPALQML